MYNVLAECDVPDIMFFENEDDPPRLPQDVRVTEVQVRPLPDGKRVVVQVTLTPFVENPSFDVTILRLTGAPSGAPSGMVERTTSVVHALDRTSALTLHLNPGERATEYVARVEVIHRDEALQVYDTRFTLSAGGAGQ